MLDEEFDALPPVLSWGRRNGAVVPELSAPVSILCSRLVEATPLVPELLELPLEEADGRTSRRAVDEKDPSPLPVRSGVHLLSVETRQRLLGHPAVAGSEVPVIRLDAVLTVPRLNPERCEIE